MANAFTPLGFIKPEVGADTDQWGGHWNENADLADTLWQRIVGTTTTHLLSFDVSAVSTTTTRTVTWIDEDVTVVGTSNTQTLSNKTLTDAIVGTQTAGAGTTLAASVGFVKDNTWFILGKLTPSGVATTAVTGIVSSVNHLMATWELTPGTDGAQFYLQTYDSGGALDSGASDYTSSSLSWNTADLTAATHTTTTRLFISGAVDNASAGFGGDFTATGIQTANFTKFNVRSTYLDSAGSLGVGLVGYGWRRESAAITGVLWGVSTGVMTGTITLYGSP